MKNITEETVWYILKIILEVQNEINVEDVTVPEAQADFKDAPADSPVEDQVDDLNTERPIRVRSQILLKEEGSRASNEVINEGAQPEEEQTFPPGEWIKRDLWFFRVFIMSACGCKVLREM